MAADLAGRDRQGRVQDPGCQRGPDRARPLADEDFHLGGRGGDAWAQPGRGQQVGGEAGRNDQRRVQAVAVHRLLGLGKGQRFEAEPVRHRRSGEQAGLDLPPDVDALAADGGAPVVIHHRHREAAQVSERVGRGRDVQRRHRRHDQGPHDQGGQPDRPDPQQPAGPDRQARVRRPAAIAVWGTVAHGSLLTRSDIQWTESDSVSLDPHDWAIRRGPSAAATTRRARAGRRRRARP